MSAEYGAKFVSVGDRVEIHPRFDLWMRGARFGTVVKVGRGVTTVKLDLVRNLFKARRPEDLKVVESAQKYRNL